MTVAPSLAPSTDFRLAIFLAAERVAPPPCRGGRARHRLRRALLLPGPAALTARTRTKYRSPKGHAAMARFALSAK